ncbi:MAG: glycosyltransferase family 2 protein [Eubacteriales bacterium]|nr:glycosyltransferase family 2 protein [Eubacteriales bacterium]
METIRTVNYVVMVLFFACYAYQFLYIPLALLKKKKPLPEGAPHRFAVLIAARNEEAVLGNLLDSLNRQTYPAHLVDLYVVADNCTDRTAETARSHGAIVFERSNRAQVGKGYALNFLINQIRTPYDGYLIFDADNLVDSHYIQEINRTFSAGYNIVTSYRNSKNYGDNWISAGYGLWFLREAQYLNRPRAALGVSCGVSGAGFLFSRKILE